MEQGGRRAVSRECCQASPTGPLAAQSLMKPGKPYSPRDQESITLIYFPVERNKSRTESG